MKNNKTTDSSLNGDVEQGTVQVGVPRTDESEKSSGSNHKIHIQIPSSPKAATSSAKDGTVSPTKAKAKRHQSLRRKDAVIKPQLEDVLAGDMCPCTKQDFRVYLESHHQDENLEFLDRVEGYRKLFFTKEEIRKGYYQPVQKLTKHGSSDSMLDKSDARSDAGISEGGASLQNSVQSLSRGVMTSLSNMIGGVGTPKSQERSTDLVACGSLPTTRAIALEIAKTYVYQDGKRQVNLPFHLRTKIEDAVSNTENPLELELFDEAALEIKKVLKLNALESFLDHIATKNLAESHVSQRYFIAFIAFCLCFIWLFLLIWFQVNPWARLMITSFWTSPFLLFFNAWYRL